MKNTFKTEIEKLSQMSKKDRIWYVWEYYKLHLAVLLALLVLLYVALGALCRQSFTPRLSVAVANSTAPEDVTIPRLESWLDSVLNCGPKEKIELNSGLTLKPEEELDSYDSISIAKLAALSGEDDGLDLILTDARGIDLCAQWGLLADLNQLLPSELWASVSQRFLPAGESDQKIAAAICLEQTSLVSKTGLTAHESPVYLAVLKNAPHREAVLQVIAALVPSP